MFRYGRGKLTRIVESCDPSSVVVGLQRVSTTIRFLPLDISPQRPARDKLGEPPHGLSRDVPRFNRSSACFVRVAPFRCGMDSRGLSPLVPCNPLGLETKEAFIPQCFSLLS